MNAIASEHVAATSVNDFQLNPLYHPNVFHPPAQIVGSANDLRCLFSFDLSYEPIYLMNPSIRKYKAINTWAIVHPTIGIDTRVMLGFGYHQRIK